MDICLKYLPTSSTERSMFLDNFYSTLKTNFFESGNEKN